MLSSANIISYERDSAVFLFNFLLLFYLSFSLYLTIPRPIESTGFQVFYAFNAAVSASIRKPQHHHNLKSLLLTQLIFFEANASARRIGINVFMYARPIYVYNCKCISKRMKLPVSMLCVYMHWNVKRIDDFVFMLKTE